MNTFRGVAIDVTYPIKLLALPNEGVHATTIEYWKSIVKDEVHALFKDELEPDIKSLFTLSIKLFVK